MDASTSRTSDSSPDIFLEGMSTSQQGDMEDGSECDWRLLKDDYEEDRPVFFMGEDEIRYPQSPPYRKKLDDQKIRVGICAMKKKASSKPMKEILARLSRFEHLQTEIFEESMILEKSVEEWPVVDALIAFFSHGFPLQKAIEYKNLRKPFVINDLEAQYALKDRREVYKILVREGIAHPRYAVMSREEEKDDFEENEDQIEVNGVAFQRPFVEKPVNAEDHNIYIYFPVSAGGGCQRLFRKVGSRSSVYSTIGRVRKTGSYIYEDFMPTDGTDVKVYTVGPDYAHAEARKSPALDGKVERDKDGKEVRYPVLLSSVEKMVARKVCLAFKQNVCGFDLLRTGGKSYVCDVNGFSFVKNSTKYYDDCANVLGTMIVRALAPQLHIQNVALVLGAGPEDIPVVPTTSGSMMELRCVIAVIRHGDRTPKQKMKMEVKHKKFFELFEKYGGYKKGHLKLKKPKQLQEVLDISRDLLNESGNDPNPEVLEKKAKLRQLKLVLEMYEFSGINRKIQLKYQPMGRPPTSSDDEYPKEPSLVLILKWGGELTPAGKYQAEDLGKAFRTLYPGGQGEFETPGLGFLRLHSTFRHDLKIYASDEGRVQMTAAAFTKGLLALEGELTPILVSMVKSANTNGLLDKEGETSKYQHIVKEKLMEFLNQDRDFTDEDIEQLAPTKNASLVKAMAFIRNPKQMCDKVYTIMQEITSKIKALKIELKSRDLKLYHGESWELLIRRWAKLEKDFKLKSGRYDISKIPDIYDCIKYDLQHNQKTLQFDRADELFLCSKALADIVIPQEYGITVEEKLHISQSICTPLMRKIHSDLHQGCLATDEESTRLNSRYSKGVSSPERFVRTRLYFTSESHIHSLLNMLRYAGLCDETKDEQWKKAVDFLSTTPELNYMTQINIMMFEDPSKEVGNPEKFHVELHFSPGAYTSSDKSVINPVGSGYRTSFLTRQGKKSHDAVKKHGDAHSDKSRHDDTGKPEVIKETITEESISEENIESDKILEASKSLTDNEMEQLSGGYEKTGSETCLGMERVPHFSHSASEIPDIILQESKEENMFIPSEEQVYVHKGDSESKQDKDIHDIENDAENDSDVHAVTQLIKNSCGIKKQSKGSQCDIPDLLRNEDMQSTETSTSDQNTLITKDTEQKVLQTEELTVKPKKKFNVEITKPAIVEPKPQELSLGKDKDPDLKSLDSPSSHDDVMFGETFPDKNISLSSDDEQTKTLTKESDLLTQSKRTVPGPKSPDPDIPEWDWDDSSSQKVQQASESSDTTLKATNSNFGGKRDEPVHESSSSTNSTSKPIQISVTTAPKQRAGSFEGMKSYDEKRSKSLEDHENKEACMSMLEKHYCTIHLPIKDSHHSFSSLLYLNPEAFKVDKNQLTVPRTVRYGSYSSPALDDFLRSEQDLTRKFDSQPHAQSGTYFTHAFDGFNMVPSLKPLETLHNNLTMRDLDTFLSRATSNKFFTPVSSPMYGATPLTSPRFPELAKTKSLSMPSSSNSSAGPSSPISATTPVDFIQKLKFYVMDHTKSDPLSITTDPIGDIEPVMSTPTNQSGESSHVTAKQTDSQPVVASVVSGVSVTQSVTAPVPSGAGSAFKTVNRSNNQKKPSMFYVSQVPEESLKVNKETIKADNPNVESKTAEIEKVLPKES